MQREMKVSYQNQPKFHANHNVKFHIYWIYKNIRMNPCRIHTSSSLYFTCPLLFLKVSFVTLF